MLGFMTVAYVLSLEVTCQRTERALNEWQLKTHAAILTAYLKLKQDCEEKLAAHEYQDSLQIAGRNPGANRLIERAELKRACITLFTEQTFDQFGAIDETTGSPEIALDRALPQGRYIRFFEEAFEWEQAMYFFYPYYWGRKGSQSELWVSKLKIDDADPLFAEFLKAGTARVVIPVRPKFAEEVAHFFETGEIWDGGDLPSITSPLYLDIIQESQGKGSCPRHRGNPGRPVGRPTAHDAGQAQAGFGVAGLAQGRSGALGP